MKNAKLVIDGHTPGSWLAKPTASLGPQYAVYCEQSGRDIAVVYDQDKYTEGNARLIAAAPALLEVCKSALACLRELSEHPAFADDAPEFNAGGVGHCAAEALRSAIAAAEGTQ